MSGTKKLAIGLLACCLAVLCGFGIWAVGGGTSPAPQQQEWVETEDCDAEDWARYEAECHRSSPKPRATKAVLAPTPRQTRR